MNSTQIFKEIVSHTEKELASGSPLSEEKDSVSAPPPKPKRLTLDMCQQVRVQLFINHRGHKEFQKMKCQLQIDGKYIDYISDLSTRWDNFQTFGNHYTQKDIEKTVTYASELRNAIATEHGVLKKRIFSGKLRPSTGKKYKKKGDGEKGHSKKYPTIPETAVFAWIDKEGCWQFVLRFHELELHDEMSDDFSANQRKKNMVADYLYREPIVFSEDEIWKPEWL